MTTKEALKELERRGVKVTYWQLRGLITRGEIATPRLDSSLRWDWTTKDISKAAKQIEKRNQAASA